MLPLDARLGALDRRPGGIALAILAWAVLSHDSCALAREYQEREKVVKVAFLYNFARFTEWPAEALGGPRSPFLFGVLGRDPFGRHLDAKMKGRTVNGRPVLIRRFDSLEDYQRCHVVFVSPSEASRLDEAIEKAAASGALVVTDSEGAATRGAMVNFFIEAGRVRFEINPEAAREAGLSISSKLLQLAKLVKTAKGRS